MSIIIKMIFEELHFTSHTNYLALLGYLGSIVK